MEALTIESSEARHMAFAIAEKTGKSIDEVVTEALRERFERLTKNKGKASLEELMAIADRIAEMAKGQPIDHGEFLYDENGLPK